MMWNRITRYDLEREMEHRLVVAARAYNEAIMAYDDFHGAGSVKEQRDALDRLVAMKVARVEPDENGDIVVNLVER